VRLDALLTFIPLGGQSMVAGAGISIPSTSIIDILGQGAGTAPQNIIGSATLFGEDPGAGAAFLQPQLLVSVGTAFVTATAATLNAALQYAVDLGTPTYQPGTWQTIIETGALTAAQLTAGQVIARFNMPPAFPPLARPRFLRMLFQVAPATGLFTAGTIAFAGFTTARDDQSNRAAARNYAVS
jgi:hypothetical protein